MQIVLIVLKILAVWTAISAVASFAFAPALSRRIRDVNFPRGKDGPGHRHDRDDQSDSA